MENDIADSPIDATDGLFNGYRLFRCHGGKGILVNPDQCINDRRFCDDIVEPVVQNVKQTFGNVDCPIVTGTIAPLSMWDA